MKKNQSLRITALTVAAAFFAPFLLSDTARAATDTVFRYSSPKTGYLQIPAAAFVGTDSDKGYDNTGIVLNSADDIHTCFTAPVNLPDRAKMTGLTVWYSQVIGTNISIQMFTQKMSDGSVSSPFSEQLADHGGGRTSAKFSIVSGQVVDNQNHNYTVQVCVNARNSEFYGARITYTYATAGD